MDSFDEFNSATSTPVTWSDIQPQPLQTPTLPEATRRNRAAKVAALSSDPSQASADYQVMMAEGDNSPTARQLQERLAETTKKNDLAGVMGVLSDPSVPLDKKSEVMKSFRDSQFLKETNVSLMSANLTKANPSETPTNERARLTTADLLKEIQGSIEEVEGIRNAHGAALKESPSMLDFVEYAANTLFGPMNNIQMGKINRAMSKGTERESTWNTIKGFLAGGTTTMDLKNWADTLQPRQRVEFAQRLRKVVEENSGIVAGSDAAINQMMLMDKILGEGGYTSTEQFLDNVFPVLDMIGLGTGLRAAGKAAKTVAKVDKAESAKIDPTMGASFPKPQEDMSRFKRKEADISDANVKWETGPKTPWSTERGVKVQSTAVTTTPPIKPSTSPEGFVAEIENTVRAIEYREVTVPAIPSSLSSIAHNTNPEQARAIHKAVVDSVDDSIAQATHGTTRTEAILSDLAPQMAVGKGSVLTKAPNLGKNLRDELGVPEEITEMIYKSGAYDLTKEELAIGRANVLNRFQNVDGLTVHPAMGGLKETSDGRSMNIVGVYGTGDGGFDNAQMAYATALHALRGTGVLPEEITILAKDGINHSPVDLASIGNKEGQYYIRVETRQELNAGEINKWTPLDTRRTWFDRGSAFVSEGWGGITRNLFDIASTIHPRISGGAVVADDKVALFEKSLLSLASEFSDKFVKLDKKMQGLVKQYNIEANFKELPFDYADILSRGISPEGADSIKSWRKFWDVHYYLENYDAIRTYRKEGFQIFENQNLTVHARPIAKNTQIGRVYDPVHDAVINVAPIVIDDLYNKGGTIARTRRPVTVNGEVFEYMLVRQTPQENLRAITNNDKILNYREGYFTLKYNNARFVDEIDSNTGITRAVAVAGDQASAELWKANAQANAAPGVTYNVRVDKRGLAPGTNDWVDVNSANGRIAQRHRGKLLEDADQPSMIGDGSFIVDPVESAVQAAKSIAHRTAMRPVLDSMKQRVLQQYAAVMPSDGMGGVRFPNSLDEVASRGDDFTGLVRDARHVVGYIRYLENGYINTVDTGFKSIMNMAAWWFGEKGFSKTERALLQAGDTAVGSLSKSAVFMTSIVMNPLRQWVIQPHQAIRTIGYNPTGWATGSVPRLVAGVMGKASGVPVTKDIDDFYKWLLDTGMIASIDKSNLVRGSLMQAADTSNSAVRGTRAVTSTMRKYGYDIGEAANILGHAAAVYDRYKRLGKDMSKVEVADEAHQEVRALMLDMNFAGDMPYNQTAASIILQFMQVPHKVATTPFNRRLDVQTRARLMLVDTLLWGAPVGMIGALGFTDILPDDEQMRDYITHGVEAVIINNFWSLLEGEKVNVDYSSLDPRDLSGWRKFFSTWMNESIATAVTTSPAGQLFLNKQGRVQQAYSAVMRAVGFEPSIDNEKDWEIAAYKIATIFSGINNLDKARIALQFEKTANQMGVTQDKKTTVIEALNQAFGFGPGESPAMYAATQAVTQLNKKRKEEVLDTYKTMKIYVQDLIETGSDIQAVSAISTMVLSAYRDEPDAQKLIASQMAMDFEDPNDKLLISLLKASGIKGATELIDTIRMAPITEEQKTQIIERIRDFNNAK